jgi:ABC-type uncharacterized transport system involved in gliding motility auxiliary subunit
MKKKQLETLLYSAVGVGAMLLLLVGFNVITAAAKQRVDLTQEKAHTLSEGTRAILRQLDTPIRVRFYCTQVENATPETVYLTSYAQQVEDLLEEFRQQARGKILLEKYNPQPDSDAEDSAKLDGIEGQGMPPYGESFYLGVSVSLLDEKVALPFLSPTRERLLEYDLARAITQVMKPEKPVVGVMSALPVFGMAMNPMMMQMGRQGQEPWIVISELRRDFTVKEIAPTVEKIDDDIRLLLVIHPRDLSEAAQYALDQFVLRGGKLVAFVDPLSIADNRNNMMNPLQRATASGSTLDKLFKAWGVEFDAGKCVADMHFKTTINRGGPRGEEAPAVLSLNRDGLNAEDVLTSQLDNLLLPYAGVFTGTPASGLQQTVLLKTSPNSQLIEKIMAEFGGGDKDFKPAGTQYALAIRLSGKFKTAFPDGKPGAKPDEKKDPGDQAADAKPATATADGSLKESAKENTVVLFADSDLLFDPVVAQVQNIFGQKIIIPMNGNLNLAQSVVEQLAGDSNLIAVRSRATLNRPFTVVKRMEERAQESFRSKIRELEASLQDTQQKLSELQRTKEKSQQRLILTPEQQQEVARFRKKEAEVKRELKDVRRNLRREIDSLENRLKWVNIAVMPFGVTISGILVAIYKRKKTAAK